MKLSLVMSLIGDVKYFDSSGQFNRVSHFSHIIRHGALNFTSSHHRSYKENLNHTLGLTLPIYPQSCSSSLFLKDDITKRLRLIFVILLMTPAIVQSKIICLISGISISFILGMGFAYNTLSRSLHLHLHN